MLLFCFAFSTPTMIGFFFFATKKAAKRGGIYFQSVWGVLVHGPLALLLLGPCAVL